MAFRKKYDKIFLLKDDILVIQENEQLAKIKFENQPTSSLWIGDNLNKGLALYTFNEYVAKINPLYNDAYKYILPIDIFKNNEKKFTLIAVWAMQDNIDRSQRYIGQAYYALREYESLLDSKVIVIGDFNWNIIWDKDKNKANFGHVLELF